MSLSTLLRPSCTCPAGGCLRVNILRSGIDICQAFTVWHPFILGTLGFSTRGVPDSPVFHVHASGGVTVTSGARGEDMTLAQPMRLAHFTAIDWFVNRYSIKSEPNKCNKDFVRTVKRGTCTFLLGWAQGDGKVGMLRAISRYWRVTPASAFPRGWLRPPSRLSS